MSKHRTLSRGVLIAIEGIDGAGKTTQTLRLRDHYLRQGFKVATFKEPTESIYGLQIRQIAQYGRAGITPQQEMELFLNDRKLDCEMNLGPALREQTLVFVDRYYFSSIAYQGSLGLDPAHILKENLEIAIQPDFTIILDVAAKLGLSRIQFGRGEIPNHFEREEYLESARRIFKQMEDPRVQVIDGTRSEDEVFVNCRNIVDGIVAPLVATAHPHDDSANTRLHHHQAN